MNYNILRHHKNLFIVIICLAAKPSESMKSSTTEKLTSSILLLRASWGGHIIWTGGRLVTRLAPMRASACCSQPIRGGGWLAANEGIGKTGSQATWVVGTPCATMDPGEGGEESTGGRRDAGQS